MMVKESIRCCISCILPCGVLDVIRIVHATGRVEEISRPSVCARDVLRVHPKHVLREPPSYGDAAAAAAPGPRGTVVVPPDAELQRGKIYFLVPVNTQAVAGEPTEGRRRRRKRRAVEGRNAVNADGGGGLDSPGEDRTRLLSTMAPSDRYLSEILSEKVTTAREGRRGRVGVWRPHLESIEETGSDQ